MGMNYNYGVFVVEIKGKQYVEYKEYERRVDDLCIQIDELESKLEEKEHQLEIKNYLLSNVDSETDRLVKLPFDAMETANMLINATYKRENCMTGKVYDKDIYDINDLEQIAEHLLVYCKYHREDEK